MRMYDIIYKKRLGGALSREEIEFAINGFVLGSVPDYQMSALAMAICHGYSQSSLLFRIKNS